jgi:hypothetical protein
MSAANCCCAGSIVVSMLQAVNHGSVMQAAISKFLFIINKA